MIGLCRGLAKQAYKQVEHIVDKVEGDPLKAIVSRQAAEEYGMWYPISERYYQLLDACPLRMSQERKR